MRFFGPLTNMKSIMRWFINERYSIIYYDCTVLLLAEQLKISLSFVIIGLQFLKDNNPCYLTTLVFCRFTIKIKKQPIPTSIN